MPDRRAAGGAEASREGARGLLVDFAGVLTTSVSEAFRRFCRSAGMPEDALLDTFLAAHDAAEPSAVQRVELGELSAAEFAAELAASLTARCGVRVASDGLIARIFAEVRLDEGMLDAVRIARAAGVRTGLVSNSWGVEHYPRRRLAGLFDTTVISAEVRLRKPDPAIYRLAADRLGLPPAACVYIDDLPSNVAAAEGVGMRGWVHRDTAATRAWLARALRVAC